MKKSLILIFVLGVASLANASVIDVVTEGIGDKGHAGTIADPLEVGEIIDIVIVLNRNIFTYNGAPYPSYDGYLLSEMDISLQVSGPGTLRPKYTDKNDNAVLDWNPGFIWSSIAFSPTVGSQIMNQNGFDFLQGQSTDGIPGYADLVGGEVGLGYQGLYIRADGLGNIQLDLSLHGLTRYSPYRYGDGPPYTPYPGGWTDATESDLGDLMIYGIPEPATILLLGLGSLFLLRRKR